MPESPSKDSIDYVEFIIVEIDIAFCIIPSFHPRTLLQLFLISLLFQVGVRKHIFVSTNFPRVIHQYYWYALEFNKFMDGI